MNAASRRALLMGGGLAALLPGKRAGAADAPTLRIAYLKAINDLTLAKAHGALERALAPMGVAVEWAGPFPAAAPAVEALNAGAVDMTVGSSTSFITSLAGGVRLVMFAYQKLDRAAEGILVAGNSGISVLRDLAGRSVAVNRGGTGEYILVRALTTAGISPEQVRRVYLGPVDANAAFVSGAVDAWAIWDPFLSIAVANGARVLADGAQCGSENAVAYFVRQAFLARHRPVVQAVFGVLRQENAWARANVSEAGAIWTRELGLNPALSRRLGENNTPPIGPVGAEAARTVERIADWYAENRIVPVRPELPPFLVDLNP
jgi:sulfonate transport system substrate-binding protein